jgi:hypothetical protein
MARAAVTGSGYSVLVCDTATPIRVTAVTSSTVLLAANDSRIHASVFNDSTATLYLLWGTGTASATNFTAKIPSQGHYELPRATGLSIQFVGQLTGAWASANGAAQVTEVV